MKMLKIKIINSIFETNQGFELWIISSHHISVSKVMVEESYSTESLDGVRKSISHIKNLINGNSIILNISNS